MAFESKTEEELLVELDAAVHPNSPQDRAKTTGPGLRAFLAILIREISGNKSQLNPRVDAKLVEDILLFSTPIVDVPYTYLEDSTLLDIVQSPSIDTISYSRNGAGFTTLAAGTADLSIAFGDAFIWRVTYKGGYTSGSLKLKLLLS